MKEFIVNVECELYTYLRNNISNKSKNNIKSLLKNECIFVNNKVVTKYNYLLKINDVVSINKKLDKNNELRIIYEDNDIIVVDKPTKILSISNKDEKENTLYRKVSDYLKKDNKKVFVIHRLDFDTSGIIMFAKNQKIQKLYQDNWNDLAIIREYTAVVEGVTDIKGHIESYLKQTKTLLVYSSNNKDGYFAITDYERIANNKKYSLLKIHISTGRRNQIRCHMNDINHPIVGDSRYNSKTNPINRLCLHANYLKIVNPITKSVMEFRSDIPNEFYSILK
ncbi:MAG: RluA family pseudouridine synthase [Bacilli bacterium]|nr:RluA family pseudouridine synthase [Bacilli bacterium]